MVETLFEIRKLIKYVLYKNYFTSTKDLRILYIFKIIEFNQKLFCYNFLSYIIWELIRIRPISITYKHRLEERLELQKGAIFVFIVIEFWTEISQFSWYKI